MILTILILLPLLGAIFAYFIPRFSRDIALATVLCTAAVAALSLGLFTGTSMQFLEMHPWLHISKFTMNYHLGVDGMSYVLVLLTILLGVVAVLVSRREIRTRERGYYAILLMLIAAVIGVFSSLDLILFFVFWEAVLVLTFLLILIWGGDNRKYAAMKFLLYTGLGSAALLLAIILLGVYATTDFTTLSAIPTNLQYVVFGLILFACFVKMPIVPFHTWLPDAHVQAPTAGSILLAGVLLKMGAYALLRFGNIFTIVHELRMFLFIMGVITIIYGAWVCLAQNNLKKLIAYSSVNHMGFVLVGIATGTALGATGAVFEMVSHGLVAALLFALAGAVHEQTGTFDLDALHGLIGKMPRTGWLLVIASLAGLGLPSMTGFIAEFIIFNASFATFGLLTLIPIAGMILTGGYFLRLLAKAVFGKNPRLVATEVNSTPFILLLIFIVILGILPFLLLRYIGV
jgi:proton-translocating NADH-quinone oxidoreductase chain M